MTAEELVSFQVAKLAKEKGFNEICDSHFEEDGGAYGSYGLSFKPNDKQEHEILYARPTQSLLQRWLRDIHDIRVLIDFETIDDSETAYTFKIVKYLPEGKGRQKDTWDFYETTYSFNQGGGWYKTYEEALELGLIEGLKLIK